MPSATVDTDEPGVSPVHNSSWKWSLLFVDSQNASHCTSLLSPTRVSPTAGLQSSAVEAVAAGLFTALRGSRSSPTKNRGRSRGALIAQSIIEIRTGKLRPQNGQFDQLSGNRILTCP